MLPRIFIDRPVFAWVIALAIMLAGIGGLANLPVEQYPDIAPTNVNIRASYPGASAEAVESSVTQVIEQQLTGIDGMLYFSANSTASGSVSISATFDKGTDPDIAQVQVQNKVQQALSRLPQAVQQQGLTVTKSNPDFLMVVSLYDTTGERTSADIGDYIVTNLQDELARLPGVGDVNLFGAPYAMRIWLDPFKLAAVQLIPEDVITAIRAQNSQVAAGQIGGTPSEPGQMLNATVTARSRLQTAEQFRDILLKTNGDGSIVRLADVARVERGAESYNFVSRLNGNAGSGIAVSLAPGADALETADVVRARVAALAEGFPEGLAYTFPNDSTAFIRLSIEEVIKTLIEAVILVVIVMFVFLQSWRATLIPAIAVPVVLLGTFGVLSVAGFSVNTLTLFAMVLAIGLLVDDAIVVVENVERVMEEEPELTVREATIKSMDELNIALIAIALVLSAVFLPMAFFGGSTGVIYKQFAITIVASMVLSVIVALTLSPALAATLLKRNHGAPKPGWRGRMQQWGQRFNAWFARTSDRYAATVQRILARRWPALLGYAVIVLTLVLVYRALPTSFLPNEDQGRSSVQFTLPAGATQERTLEVAKAVERYFTTEEKANIRDVFTITGGNQAGSGQNAGRGFIALADWSERTDPENTSEAIAERATKALSASIRDARINVNDPSPVRGLGQANGFSMQLLNTGGLTREAFVARRDAILQAAENDPLLSGVRVNALDDNPTLKVDVDQAKVGALGLSQSQVDSTLSTAWGGTYVNDFIDRGRVKRVYVQGDAPYRARPEDLAVWHVRGASGTMAPYSAFARLSWAQAPTSLGRFNGLPAFEFQGQPAMGRSSGEAMDRIAEIAGQQAGVGVAWSGASYQEREASGQAGLVYGLALIVVFLCLAALYESWSIPLSVLVVIPIGLVGATLAVWTRGLTNDIYFQVGLITTMGLTAKNAILIVEFAELAELRGKTPVAAAIEAARLRLRPIVMTSLAFIMGVMPLVLSTGAGAKSRIAIGTAVAGGTLFATVLAIFFVPLFFVIVRELFAGTLHKPGEAAAEPTPPSTGDSA